MKYHYSIVQMLKDMAVTVSFMPIHAFMGVIAAMLQAYYQVKCDFTNNRQVVYRTKATIVSKMYVVQNNQDLIMGIFRKHYNAHRFADKVGKKRWNENWKVTPIIIGPGGVASWVLAGGEAYRAKVLAEEMARSRR